MRRVKNLHYIGSLAVVILALAYIRIIEGWYSGAASTPPPASEAGPTLTERIVATLLVVGICIAIVFILSIIFFIGWLAINF